MDKNIYSPHEVAMLGLEQAKRAADHANFGIELNIPGTYPSFGDYFAPLLPWEICAVQAQTSNGKTTFTNWWMRQIADQLKRQGRDEIIVHVSLEESVEAQAFSDYGRILGARPADFARGAYTDWDAMKGAMAEIDGVPVWRIADSASRPVGAPELHLTNIYKFIMELANGEITGEKWTIAAVIIDYLQALPIDPEVRTASRENQRRLQVAQDVFRLREMTTRIGAPIIVPLQAKQKLDGANPPMQIPGMYDGLETSAIATRFDRIISLWMPKTTHVVGTAIELPTGFLEVQENQAFIKVNKQRGGLPAGGVWELAIDYETQSYTDAYKTK